MARRAGALAASGSLADAGSAGHLRVPVPRPRPSPPGRWGTSAGDGAPQPICAAFVSLWTEGVLSDCRAVAAAQGCAMSHQWIGAAETSSSADLLTRLVWKRFHKEAACRSLFAAYCSLWLELLVQ